jgi:hypothetical protein
MRSYTALQKAFSADRHFHNPLSSDGDHRAGAVDTLLFSNWAIVWRRNVLTRIHACINVNQIER